MTKVFESMGTVVSLEPPRRFVDVQSIFRAFDERFSLFRSESEISRLAGGSLALLNASEELRSAYARALEWRSLTAGAFTPHRPARTAVERDPVAPGFRYLRRYRG
jgi:thiamine biosynthesis lipoprotein